MNVRCHAGWIVGLLAGFSTAVAQPPAGVELAPQTGHTAGVTAVAFRPGAAQLLSASSDGSAILWDAATGRQLRTYRGGPLSNSFLTAGELQEAKMPPDFPVAAQKTPAVAAVQFSPDGRWFVMACRPEGFLATLEANCQAVVWDTESGKRIRAFDLALDSGAIALGRDGTQLLCGGQPMDPAEVKDLEEMGVKERPCTGAVLWDVATGKEIRQYGAYDAAYEAVGFSPDGRYVLGGGRDMAASAMPPPSAVAPLPAPPPAPAAPPAPAPAAIPSPAPKSAAKPDASPPAAVGVLRLWDAATGQQVLELRPQNAVRRAVFSPSGTQILTIGAETLELWDTATKKRLLSVPACVGMFSADGKQLLAIEPQGKVGFWDVSTGKEVRWLSTHFEGVKDVALSADGAQMLVGMTHQSTPPQTPSAPPPQRFTPGEAVLLELASGRVLHTFAARTDPVDFVAASPTGGHVLIGDSLWDTASGQKLGNLCRKPVQAFSATFSPDGKRALAANHQTTHFLSGLFDGLFGPSPAQDLATLVEIPTGKELVKYEVKHPVNDRVALGFSADGVRALTAVRGGAIGVWDVAQGKRLFESRIACNDLAAAVSPDGKTAAVSFHEDKIVWWDHVKGQQVSEQGRQKGPPTRPGLPPTKSPDGRLQLALAEDDWALVVQEPAKPATARTLKAGLTPYESIRAAGFDARDGRFVFAEVSSPYAGLWDVEGGKRLREFSPDEPFSAEVLAFAPDGQHVAGAGNDGQVTIWAVATGKKVSAIKLPSPVVSMAYSADGKLTAAGCADRSAVVARLDGGQQTILRGHEGPVDAVAFRPDGRMLLTACRQDGTARIWDVAAGKELARIVSIHDRSDWLVFTPEGLYDGSEGGRQRVAFRVGQGLDVQPPAADQRPQPGLFKAIWGQK